LWPKEPLYSRVEPIKGVPYIFVTEGGLEESPEKAHVIGISEELLRQVRYIPALEPA
jgi:hypothetical protein